MYKGYRDVYAGFYVQIIPIIPILSSSPDGNRKIISWRCARRRRLRIRSPFFSTLQWHHLVRSHILFYRLSSINVSSNNAEYVPLVKVKASRDGARGSSSATATTAAVVHSIQDETIPRTQVYNIKPHRSLGQLRTYTSD